MSAYVSLNHAHCNIISAYFAIVSFSGVAIFCNSYLDLLSKPYELTQVSNLVIVEIRQPGESFVTNIAMVLSSGVFVIYVRIICFF